MPNAWFEAAMVGLVFFGFSWWAFGHPVPAFMCTMGLTAKGGK